MKTFTSLRYASMLGLCFLLLALNVSSVWAQSVVSRPDGAVMVPENFLRSWDPVTFFFDEDLGPQNGAAEDHPEKVVTMSPAHPGAYKWVNARTLQFRPAEAWPPLARFSWSFSGYTKVLSTLMAPPVRSLPVNGATDLSHFESFTLVFDEPVGVKALGEMLAIEWRPLPGIDVEPSRYLAATDFIIKEVERASPSEKAQYVIRFKEPVPEGIKVIVRMRLSLAEASDKPFQEITFKTVQPFRLTRLDCSRGRGVALSSGGVRYGRDQAIQCDGDDRKMMVSFSAEPTLDPVAARNLVRFTPNVPDLDYKVVGNVLVVSGRFKASTVYRVGLYPTAISDHLDRSLEMSEESEAFVYFPQKDNFLTWRTSQGVVERFGPQMLPLKGRGEGRLDLRIHKVGALDRSFWPFPDQAVAVNEEQMPPGPGEEPAPFDDVQRYISASELGQQLQALGSPSISEIIETPLGDDVGAAKFGLDIAPQLARISGGNAPGTYLVGVRRLGSDGVREWMRLQVTDLSLTTVEEANGVRFAVTSISSGQPVSGAQIEIQGVRGHDWETFFSAKTDAQGLLPWQRMSNGFGRMRSSVRRIVVRYGDDQVVFDPTRPPDTFVENHWGADGRNWLQWTQNPLPSRITPKQVCHVFTERPMYKPDQPIHIKAYVRDYLDGRISISRQKAKLTIKGPGDELWNYQVEPNAFGSLYKLFDETTTATGQYSATLTFKNGECSVSFNKEAYRLPKFEVGLFAPKQVRFDAPFSVKLAATYYAGGTVAKRPVRWRVTQFPHTWVPEVPAQHEGYYFSSDSRFSGEGAFNPSPTLTQNGETDESGAATLSIDPSNEPTAHPRLYVVEATVTGADDQTVTNVEQVVALPPFVLGLKVPRYLEKALSITPQIIAVGHKGELIEGQEITVRLLRRQWSSILQASDFTSGEAKYLTQVIDETVEERTLQSAGEALMPEFKIAQAGVYIIELEAHDKMGRAQTVRLDLFAGGDQPVTWSNPPTQVFKATPDKADYLPGEEATIILESPFQEGRALAVIEHPDGSNDYSWVAIKNGAGQFKFTLERRQMPQAQVHFVLMRGRVGMSGKRRAGGLDLGKPTTIAASLKVKVSKAKHKVYVTLDYDDAAQPGQDVDIKIHLKDQDGAPLSGEVTMWLVDQAVLALGKEQSLDPLDAFVIAGRSRIAIRDSRNMVMGWLPLEEQPGGGIASLVARLAERADSLLDKVTIRKNFTPVPYYNPSIIIDESGETTVQVTLPDNLTNFKIRAKAVSGDDRFGLGMGHLRVRLPVLVQPALPRFVRPGDEFIASAIGRIVEGEGGGGRAEIKLEGLDLHGVATQAFEWSPDRPQKLNFNVSVPTPTYNAQGRLERDSVLVTLGVERQKDKAADAFSVHLPIKADRRAEVSRRIETLGPNAQVTFPAIEMSYRPGTLKRSLLLSSEPAVLKMAVGLDYVLNYPFGCTEQQISAARSYIATRRFGMLLDQTVAGSTSERVVEETLAYLNTVLDTNGLVSFWPGSQGYVPLTAWSVQFMLEAKDAGFAIDQGLLEKMLEGLRASLRSDSAAFSDLEDYGDRTWALAGLTAAGRGDPGYGAELVRRSQFLNAESLALVTWSLSHSERPDSIAMKTLYEALWKSISFKERDGQMVYAGLQGVTQSRSPQILPSETRTVAEILRAMATAKGQEGQLNALLQALVRLGKKDGWGTTNANAAALTALSSFLSQNTPQAISVVNLTYGADLKTFRVGEDSVVLGFSGEDPAAMTLKSDSSTSVRLVDSYVAAEPGSEVAATSNGFVVTRKLHQVDASGPGENINLDNAGKNVNFVVGDVVEDQVDVVNPENRTQVAVVVPLAAGFEALNPALATAPPEAKTQVPLTLQPSYVAFLDDQVAYFYDDLPKGTYHFAFRAKATISGSFTQPSAFAQMMYDETVNGRGNAARISIAKQDQ